MTRNENVLSVPHDGILLIDKPKGVTSFDCIRMLRKKLGVQKPLHASHRVKMGHAGTLDPLATGLMIIGVGRGTKKLSNYLKLPKTYRAEIMFGVRTDTGDMDGTIVEEADASDLSRDAVADVLVGMVGDITLPVPRYSAIKRGGKRLYALARTGVAFVPPERVMHIDRAELMDIFSDDDDHHRIAVVDLAVASGTYIRSIAEHLGEKMGLPATLRNLRRTSIGSFCVDDAYRLSKDS